MNASYTITLNYVKPEEDLTLIDGTREERSPYYQGRIIRLGILATGSTWNEALNNTITAASASPFNNSH